MASGINTAGKHILESNQVDLNDHCSIGSGYFGSSVSQIDDFRATEAIKNQGVDAIAPGEEDQGVPAEAPQNYENQAAPEAEWYSGASTLEFNIQCTWSRVASTEIAGIKQNSESDQGDLDENNRCRQECFAKSAGLCASSEDAEVSKNQGVCTRVSGRGTPIPENQGVRAAVPGSKDQGVRVTVPGNQGVETPSYKNQGVRADGAVPGKKCPGSVDRQGSGSGQDQYSGGGVLKN